MANLNTLFWVRASQTNKKGLAPLMLRITIPIKDVADFSSGKMVDPKLWNADRKQVNGRSDSAEQINKYIVSSAAKIQKIYDELEREERPISSEVVKNIFLGKNQVRITMLSALEEHNNAFKTKIEKEGKLSPDTLKKFEQLKIKLVAFMNFKYNRKDVFIAEVNFGFIEDFRTWLLQYGHHKLNGLSSDSATGHLKKLHKIILRLFKRGLIKVDPFLDIDLKWEDPTAEALSEDQLEKLENLKLHSPRLQQVLDRFIVGCYSGLSNSDISKVGPDDIIKNFVDDSLWLRLRRTKTDTVCKIPLLPPVLAVIEKYKNDPKCIKENKLFPVVSLNTCNVSVRPFTSFPGYLD